jgi:protein required for attachment to host cells
MEWKGTVSFTVARTVQNTAAKRVSGIAPALRQPCSPQEHLVMNVRVLVADERQATFFDAADPRKLKHTATVINPVARLKEQDLVSDRPGRTFDSEGAGRHAMDGERSAVQREIRRFARDVVANLEQARINHEFDRAVIVAGPRMLGLLRDALSKECRSLVVAEIDKDLPQEDEDDIRSAIPPEAFAMLRDQSN